MEDTRALNLFKEIQDKTRSRKLAWEPTAIEDVFMVPVKGKYIVKAYPYTIVQQEGGPQGPPSFTFYEGDDMILDITHRSTGILAEALTDLYALVKRQALKTDEKLDDILSELKKL